MNGLSLLIIFILIVLVIMVLNNNQKEQYYTLSDRRSSRMYAPSLCGLSTPARGCEFNDACMWDTGRQCTMSSGMTGNCTLNGNCCPSFSTDHTKRC
ncbi:hypothetical protein OAG24_00970 [bacterium]|nr:hypothetical protein [bacterium]